MQSARLTSVWTRIPRGSLHALTNLYPPPMQRPVVVLVHGLVISSSYMMPTAERLAPLCRVYAPDLPGYGLSFKPRPILLLPELADALAQWMDALNLARAYFVGNSFGCQVIAHFAVRHPARVERLVLQGPTVDPRSRSIPRQFLKLLINSLREPRGLGRLARKDYARAGLTRVKQTMRLAMADPIEVILPHVRAPALVVRGARDPLVPPHWADQVTQLLPQGELRVIPGAPHTINYSAPLEFVRVMKPFLQLQPA